MIEAAQGVWAAFVVTQFWEKMDEGDEVNQGCTTIEALHHAKVQHIVLSTLPSAIILTNGRLCVPHFDGKWRFTEYMRYLTGMHFTMLFVPFYFENFLNFTQKTPDGKYVFTASVNGRKFGAASVEDVGGITAAVLKEPARYHNKLIDMFANQFTLQEACDTFTRVTGKQAVCNDMSPKQFAKLPMPAAHELANMYELFQVIADLRHGDDRRNPYNQLGIDDHNHITGRSVYPGMMDFEHWIVKSGFGRT